MGSRPGDLDPGILTHLMHQGLTLGQLRHLLNSESGLRGLAGTDDMRELLRREDEAAALAVEIFCYRALKYVGAYLTVLGGAEAIVFTGGIGERSPRIRERICRGLAWLGLDLDPARNARSEERISRAASRLGAYMIRSDEERMIAREAGRLLAGSAQRQLSEPG